MLISFENWLQRNGSSSKTSKLTGNNQKVERKWSLAAQLSNSFPMHSWSNMSYSRGTPVDDAVATPLSTTASKVSPQINTDQFNPSYLLSDKSSSPRPGIR